VAEAPQSNAPKLKPPRPLGVWVLTVYAAIFAGLAPLLLETYFLATGSAGFNPYSLVFSIVVNAAVVYLAVRTWQGNNFARKLFIIFVTINYVLVGLNNLAALNAGPLSPDEQMTFIARIARGVLFPAIYIWYFNRRETKKFYMT
jgi:hypothetical protein